MSGCGGSDDELNHSPGPTSTLPSPSTVPPTSTAPAPNTTELPSELEAYVGDWAEENGVVGAVVLVVRSDGSAEEVAYGFADREDEVPIEVEDAFRIGSITKIYTAALVLDLVRSGQVGLDDSASTFIEELPEQVTVQDLLAHTSGLRDIEVAAGVIEAIQNGEDTGVGSDAILDAIAAGLVFEPGTRQSYSSIGYLAIERILETITGRTYGELLAEFLGPKGITAELETAASELPTSYERFGPASAPVSLASLPTSGFNQGAGAAGAIVASAADVAAFIRALFSGKIVEAGDLAMMMDVSPPRQGYGLGLSTYELGGATVFGHNGRTIGFATALRHDPESNTTVVVLANDGGAPADELADDLVRIEINDR